MNKRNLLILSIVLIAISMYSYFYLGDYFENIDMELVQFFSGLFFALGIGNLLRVFIGRKKIENIRVIIFKKHWQYLN